MVEIGITITGLNELIAKIDDPDLLGKPIYGFLRDSISTVIQNVVKHNPNDTGRSSADITQSMKIDTSPLPLWASMGSSITKPPYPVFMEMGTRPHWPPKGALKSWAHRHGISEFLVRRAIARHGTAPRKMFERGTEESTDFIETRLAQTAAEIENIWGSK